MCGISGLVNSGNEAVARHEIESMNRLVSHRGPDAEGYFLRDSFALGHRRLSILDLSEQGAQPMCYRDYVMTYNGEVYNYLEIRQELETLGHTFRSTTDSEVILVAYAQWGEQCVERFNGMWAFVIYDPHRQVLFCSRDHFGIKPFYYTQCNGRFGFGSEIRQLMPLQPTRRVNEKVLSYFLVAECVEFLDGTFIEGINKLPASHNLIYDLRTNTFQIKRYYRIQLADLSQLSLDESIEAYDQEFQRAIRIRLRSDVQVGTCLSGGIDSSLVAATSARFYNSERRFCGIHARSSEKWSDESEYAKAVAKQSNIDLHIVTPTTDDFIQCIDEVVVAQEEPFGTTSVFMQYLVMKKAREIGCTVMLDGQGGDETMLGYDKYVGSVFFDVMKSEGILKSLGLMRDYTRNNSNLNWLIITKFVAGACFPKLRNRQRRWKSKYVNKSFVHDYPELVDYARSFRDVIKLQRNEIERTNIPALLRYEDKNSMCHSIEARLPFLDHQLLELALSLRTKFKSYEGWSKYILRRILEKSVSKDICWRKSKLSFESPENSWISKIGPQMLETILRSDIIQHTCDTKKVSRGFPAMDVRTRWRLFSIAKWEAQFKVTIG